MNSKLINFTKRMKAAWALVPALGLMTTGIARADTFGSGLYEFTLSFVDVGNAGNANDAGAGGGIYSSPYGGVNYNYRISTGEINVWDIERAKTFGLTHVTTEEWFVGYDGAARDISWMEAAAFVNWLNTSKGYHAAYNLTWELEWWGTWGMSLWEPGDQATTGVDSGTNPYRHKNAFYFLPSEDEWYKAAYHKNDGVTANYWDYTTGSNTPPTPTTGGTSPGTAIYNGVIAIPMHESIAGGPSPYGTVGQNGNVWEWVESAADGTNNDPHEVRMTRGGSINSDESHLRSSNRAWEQAPWEEYFTAGFRVASVEIVPEPSTALLVLMAGGAWLVRRRARRSL